LPRAGAGIGTGIGGGIEAAAAPGWPSPGIPGIAPGPEGIGIGIPAAISTLRLPENDALHSCRVPEACNPYEASGGRSFENAYLGTPGPST